MSNGILGLNGETLVVVDEQLHTAAAEIGVSPAQLKQAVDRAASDAAGQFRASTERTAEAARLAAEQTRRRQEAKILRGKRTVVLNERGGRTSVSGAKPRERSFDPRPKCPACKRGRLMPGSSEPYTAPESRGTRAERRRADKESTRAGAAVLRCTTCSSITTYRSSR